MFEKFNQKAIDVIQSAQNWVVEFDHSKVTSAHILLGLYEQTKGVQAKILNFDKIDFEKLKNIVKTSLKQEKSPYVIFSVDAREILKSLKAPLVTPLNIALALFQNKNCYAYKIIKSFELDENKIIPNIERMLQKKSDNIIHPEDEPEDTNLTDINGFFKEEIISEILSNAQSKITASGYEIMGTEQIMQAILDNNSYKIVEFLNKYGIDSESFSKSVASIGSRSAEFENSQKQYIFTPNAFSALMLALDCAKESGSVKIMPEHVVLGILKSQKGIAYKILSKELPDDIDFEEVVMKKMDDNVHETLAILRLAKEEARLMDCSIVGSEMVLLGILSYGAGIAANVLRQLEINIKDARSEIKKYIKPQKNVENLQYSVHARKMLEIAYETAQEHKKSKIKSENLLYAITKIPNCLAMKVLSNLGTDILEIRQGIKQELLGGMEL